VADLSFAQLEGAWIQAGGSPAMAPLMAAIALAESSGNPDATNPTDNGGTQTSWGLWQISNGDHSEPSPTWNDPVENARLAVGKIRSQGLGAWGTYTSGAYRQYEQSGVAPDTSGTSGAGGAPSAGATPGTAQAGFAGPLGDWLGNWLGTIAGNNPGLALPGIVGTTLGPIANVFTDFDHALSSAMHGVLWIVNPMNWVRITAGVLGGAAVITGTVMLFQAA
jgi:hypothetical protein